MRQILLGLELSINMAIEFYADNFRLAMIIIREGYKQGCILDFLI
jgi:hypothetical protein